MSTQPLIGAAYSARSIIANAQRCVNLYPEVNREDAPFPTTHYPTPGLTAFTAPPASGVGRGVYTATNGMLYAAVKDSLYRVSDVGFWTFIGYIQSFSTPISMADNGVDLMIVDGSSGGYQAALSSTSLSVVSDPNFLGGTLIGMMDQRFVTNQPTTRNMIWSDFNTTAFNGLNIAAKIGYSDILVGCPVLHREVWMIGQLTTQVFYATGASDSYFGILPGVFMEHGCVAPYSIATQDLQVYWLSMDKQGRAIVMLGTDYKARRVSTHAIEQEFQSYSTLSDAVAFTYQQDGHTFYVLNFPTADKTWAYDITASELSGVAQWHERASTDSNGQLHRHRPIAHASAYGKNIVQDWQTGQLYYYDLSVFQDNGTEVPRIRSFPHMKNEAKYVEYNYLVADFEVGNGASSNDETIVSLRYSDDAGRSWSDYLTLSLGAVGDYIRSMKWARLGTARDRVFELSWSANDRTALNGAYLDPKAAAA